MKLFLVKLVGCGFFIDNRVGGWWGMRSRWIFSNSKCIGGRCLSWRCWVVKFWKVFGRVVFVYDNIFIVVVVIVLFFIIIIIAVVLLIFIIIIFSIFIIIIIF
jgi:hypothetical protein